ncbi:type III restriction endonuclease subunit R, partial [bacterium]|nr:type III restriction endonuclease subunit R [bacterium]
MNRQVNAIANRLSLRPPQRESLAILDRITELVPLSKTIDLQESIEKIHGEFPTVTDFEREFVSLCFALATGVGKTRLMGAFIAYLHNAHGLRNFFVLAPSLTIYNKLITDFTPNTPKYVFKGIAEFAVNPPSVITGDNYEQGGGIREGRLPGIYDDVHINIFNISKINSEVRGGKIPRIKRLSEYIGESYFDYLSNLTDLVLIMDESHRYRGSAGVQAINELKPVLGLELTATPFVEMGNKKPVSFKNVIYDYSLSRAMEDGFVKEPAVVTRKNFNPNGMSKDQVELIKLEDGIRLHEEIKVQLEIYARETNNVFIKPFVLVIASDTVHASQLVNLIQSPQFFGGRYSSKVIQVDSSKSGAEEDQMIQRLLAVESTEEPTEIVVHVNMLKEGWDVTNLYTIIPLRAANAKTLIHQSIGRGLRLPYGKRTGVKPIDSLNIIAHDKFQEIVDEAKQTDSIIQMQTILLDSEKPLEKSVVVVSQPILSTLLGIKPSNLTSNTFVPGENIPPAFDSKKDQELAQLTHEVIQEMAKNVAELPSASALNRAEIQAKIVVEVAKRAQPVQMELEGILPAPDIARIVAKTSDLIIQQIDIPKITVQPNGEIRSGFHPFELNLTMLNYVVPSEDLWIQHLRTQEREVLGLTNQAADESRLEDIIVNGLIDFDDIAYEHHADLLYELASQTIMYFRAYVSLDEDIRKILRIHQREITRLIYSQMQAHYWEEAVGFEVKVN